MPGSFGVIGGTFDPIHNGHLAIATLAREALGLKKIIFIPSGNPPHKQETLCANAVDRLAMLRLALKDDKHAVIRDNEIKRPGLSYTIETINELKVEYGSPLHFIIGSDNIAEIPLWHRYKEFLQSVILCVAYRPGYPENIPQEMSFADIVKIPSPYWGISSSMIREYLRKKYSCRYLLPDSVIDYIKENRLYQQIAEKI